jgi:hypothetical protein
MQFLKDNNFYSSTAYDKVVSFTIHYDPLKSTLSKMVEALMDHD